MKNSKNVLSYSSLLILAYLIKSCESYLMNPQHCSSSSCGVIHNISFPFRLKDDPKSCGDPSYELACEHNVTTLYLNSEKFIVRAISYKNNTIRVASDSINNNTCSFPTYSFYGYNFSDAYPYSVYQPNLWSNVQENVAWPINFMSCPNPLKNSSLLTDTGVCALNSSNVRRYGYIRVGHMSAVDVEYMCRLDSMVLTSWKFKDSDNVSLLEIHESLMYGFELSWYPFKFVECKDGRVWSTIEEPLKCDEGFRIKLHLSRGDVLILVLIVVVPAGPGVRIIVGFAYFWVIFIVSNTDWFFDSLRGTLLNILLIFGVSLAARFIILFPCVMGFLIYKFRRRRFSVFDEIEDFLRSDNTLMPIRYSYSDLRTMTRGFREKLGEGGFGAVYKGKLRSGHHVAVKLLGRPGGNDRDFMNEISTIGRIHHYNVVKLVGYCADRSKRALVYDFMSNGSLEKYIFSQGKMSSLTWDKKFEIAVGVARGIQYLHQGCDIQILHFDIKPHNILLDDKFIPKISDFGLAKFCSTDKKTVSLTAVRGTIGYVAPELINRGIGEVSFKADVYSFGMLLMEIVGVNRDSRGNDNATSSQYFPCWIYDCFDQGKDIVFGKAEDEIDDGMREIARKMTIVALWCIQMSPDARPSMNKVVEMLEGGVERLQIPNRQSQSPRVRVIEDRSWSDYSNDSISLLDAVPSVEIIVEDLQSS